MNELVTLGLLAAGAYIVAKQGTAVPVVEMTSTTRDTPATTVEQTAVEELRASGQLVTGLVDIQTAAGQTVTAIVAPTPDVPNRAIMLDPDDLTRIQGKYVPRFVMTPDIQDQLTYLGYNSWNDLVPYLMSGKVWFYGPAAHRIKFVLPDWEYWRTVTAGGSGGPPALTQAQAPELWNVPLTQEEYFGVRDRFGLYPPSLRGLGSLGCGCAWAT